jgi:hypothetical protein
MEIQASSGNLQTLADGNRRLPLIVINDLAQALDARTRLRAALFKRTNNTTDFRLR